VLASTGTVAQAADSRNDHRWLRAKTGADRRLQASHIPRSLLYSSDHGDLAVCIWADYESLMTPVLGGGHGPAVAGRRYLAEAYGTSTDAVDDARRQLLRDGAGGAYLARSSPRGRQKTVQHMARRRPKDTRAAFVPVPAWTRTLVWSGKRRPQGRISAGAWRLYAAMLDKALRNGEAPEPFETTVETLGKVVGASPRTARRRLGELEAAGLVTVAERPGGRRISVGVLTDPAEAERVANANAEHGRTVVDPGQIRPLTPDRFAHSPRTDSPTPCTQPPDTQPPTTQPSPPAVGELQVPPGPSTVPADAGESQDSRTKTGPTPKRPKRAGTAPAGPVAIEAARLYRLLPDRLRDRVPAHGLRRVMRAIVTELETRTATELAERITRRSEAWAYRIEDVTDPTAVATAIVRRGYDCVDVRCEDHHRLDTGQPCGHCADRPPARTVTGETAGNSPGASLLPPRCGDPRHDPLADAANRLLVDEDGLPIGPCPRCSIPATA
jgi:DNA-binding transcriptional ArsR family regulator